jgi:hypothetical protein
MHGDLAPVLRHDQVLQQAGDAAIDQQLFAPVGRLGALTGHLDDDARTTLDEWIVVRGIAQHLNIGVVVQVVTGLEFLVGADDAADARCTRPWAWPERGGL